MIFGLYPFSQRIVKKKFVAGCKFAGSSLQSAQNKRLYPITLDLSDRKIKRAEIV
jgi:hypothetical protein